MLKNRLIFFTSILMFGLEIEGLKCDDVTKHSNYYLINRTTAVCGKNNLTNPFSALFSGRIRGGADTLLPEFPWMVYLEISKKYKPSEFANFCGGNLINNRYVLTAAHCTSSEGPGIEQLKIVARIGDWNLPNKDSNHQLLPVDQKDCSGSRCAPQVQQYQVSEYHRHRRFNSEGHHDICLMRLGKTVQFNQFVRPICLPLSCYLQQKPLECYDLTVIGWGINDKNRFPNILQKLRVEVVRNDICQAKYQDKYIMESQLCAGTVQGESSCRGDSGGPLMFDQTIRNITTYYLMGIDSFGFPCHRPAQGPHVSTRVTFYLRWILNQMRP